ncbi:MAG: hypothetical protein ACLFMO_08275 [Eubacteriales bacterium]
MDENKTLYKLKELEYLERICDKVGNIPVVGGGNLIEHLREMLVSLILVLFKLYLDS